MNSLTAIDLLQIWEEGMDQSLSEKTLRLLGKACSVADYAEIGRLSIGERDGKLLQLREWMFGTNLNNITNCPRCDDVVEWEMITGNLYMKPVESDLSVKTFLVNKDDFSVSFRLPDTHDMIRVSADKAYLEDPKKLLSDCILEIHKGGKKHSSEELPVSVWEALNESMEKEDPQADLRIKIQCPVCSHHWEAPFDIVSFLWAEINNWARRILQEVYMLANAMGWSEQDILKMSARRRQFYLQMIGA